MSKRKNEKVENRKSEEIEQLESQLKRSLADYQNLEKRTAEERVSWIRKANKDLILRLLPILDTLILANAHVQNEGLGLSIKQFLDILRNEGVEKIETVGQDFNPSTMEGVGTIEGEEGKVVQEVRLGFKYEDESVIRPAQVLVGQ